MSRGDQLADVLPGFLRADLRYLAECLEGIHGEGRVAEAAPQAAQFIRAALALQGQIVPARLPLHAGDALVAGNTPGRAPAKPLEQGTPDAVPMVLTPAEASEINAQRARAERNRGDPE